MGKCPGYWREHWLHSNSFGTSHRTWPKVYAFEPEPFNFSILQQTALHPEFEGKIIAMQFAVGAENGSIDLWMNHRHHADHRIVTEQFRSEHPGRKKPAYRW